ncbi:MAG: MATE family efflux transporter [Candidatus Zixiibacteriota bacterium]
MSVISNNKKVMKDYTEGSIIQSILKMGIPSMVGFLASHIYYMIDMWWLSRLPIKETAVAAVTIYSNVAWVFFSFNMLIGAGSVAIISRRYGEKNPDHTEVAIKETFLLKFVLGIAIGLIGYLMTDYIVYFAGARDETLRLGILYGKVIFLGMAFNYSTYSVYTAMRGVANPNMAMALMLGSTVMNLVLDPLFIFGWWIFPELGVQGAAVASVTSYALTFLAGLAVFYAGIPNVKLNLRGKESISIKTMIQIIKIGTPSWLGNLSYSASRLVVMPMIAIFGDSVVAAYGVGMQISAIGISILVGIGLGLASLIGHNLGGGKKERAKKTANQAILLAVGIMTVIGLITLFMGRSIMSLYFSNDETIRHGIALLRIFAIAFPFWGIWIMLEEIYSGVGLNMPAMIVSTSNAWLIQIPMIFILTRVLDMNQTAVWWSMMFASVISAVAFYIYYRRGQWLDVKV